MAVQLATDANFNDLLAQHPRVIVKYFADWCGSCRLIAPKYKRLSDDPANQGTVFLEVNAEHSPEARKLAGVTNLPFFATFAEGQLRQADFTSKIENVQAMLADFAAATAGN